LTRTMLAAVGVKSHIALFNNEGSINDPSCDLPIPNLFDHALLLVEDRWLEISTRTLCLKVTTLGNIPSHFSGGLPF